MAQKDCDVLYFGTLAKGSACFDSRRRLDLIQSSFSTTILDIASGSTDSPPKTRSRSSVPINRVNTVVTAVFVVQTHRDGWMPFNG